MAKPIPFSLPVRDPREVLLHQLERAPQEHAAALLDAYAILQLLRDKGILEIIKGALGSGEKVLGILTKTLESDELVRTIRNVSIMIKIIGSVEPEVLESIVRELSISIIDARTKKPPGLVQLLGKLSGADSRRALAPMAAALEALGQNLSIEKVVLDGQQKPKRHKTIRHRA